MIVALRVAVGFGALLFVAGGWMGWYGLQEAPPGFPRIRAHQLREPPGALAWFIVVPLLAASVAPFARRTVRWLWLTAVPPLAAALFVGIAQPEVRGPFGNTVLGTSPSPWLWASVAGSVLALGALLGVWAVGRRRPDVLRAAGWQPLAATAVVLIASVAIVQERGVRDHETERVGVTHTCRDGNPVRYRAICRKRIWRDTVCAEQARCGDAETFSAPLS